MKDRVISLRRPWASLILQGLKSIETRTWRTSIRGRLYIHVSQGAAAPILAVSLPPQRCPPPLDPGFVHGYVDVVGIRVYMDLEEFLADQDLHRCRYHPPEFPVYGWELLNPVTIQPIPCRGQQRIFRRDLDAGGSYHR